ncbi:hypothetical protein LAZ67_1005428 [Cordylochernes scorpioides]|uniref:Ig-like domain-containing protein n=1 Tax=Cordylochernes scorpioides TaxID=51811 RepID=A0ABY6JY39_9ARAC|nr:hypothetical protein LAZ67_1005428 [Cordylochernes scorpioides]
MELDHKDKREGPNQIATRCMENASFPWLVPPRWTVEPRDISVVAGQPVLMDCVAEGLPNPSVLWRKKQVQLFSRDVGVVKTVTLWMPGSHYSAVTPGYRRQMLENGTLSLVAAEPGDAGHYMCQAANGVGAGLSKVVSLTVHSKSIICTQ